MKSILFVCLGNICRSPLAEGIAKKMVKENNLDITIDSAGTSGWHDGEPPHVNSCLIAKKYNVDIANLRSRKITRHDDKFDLIITMDSNNYNNVLKLGFDKNKVKKLGDYGLNGIDIPDPYYEDKDGFEKIYIMIAGCIENLLKEYKQD